jgi:hypothetical protein
MARQSFEQARRALDRNSSNPGLSDEGEPLRGLQIVTFYVHDSADRSAAEEHFNRDFTPQNLLPSQSSNFLGLLD